MHNRSPLFRTQWQRSRSPPFLFPLLVVHPSSPRWKRSSTVSVHSPFPSSFPAKQGQLPSSSSGPAPTARSFFFLGQLLCQLPPGTTVFLLSSSSLAPSITHRPWSPKTKHSPFPRRVKKIRLFFFPCYAFFSPPTE